MQIVKISVFAISNQSLIISRYWKSDSVFTCTDFASLFWCFTSQFVPREQNHSWTLCLYGASYFGTYFE